MKDDENTLHLITSHLVSLSARKSLEKPPEETEVGLARRSVISVLKQDKDRIRARFSVKVFFKPYGPFEIDLEMDAIFRVDGVTPKETVLEEALEAAATSLYARASHIVAFISDQMITFPFIMPPFKESADEEVSRVPGAGPGDS